ncbi:MAG: ATP-binding cassette domain-containing protein [Kiritimatiellae bacterium]|nr:ATP-binding cassette domain-containing protein [Kiritimatiellia bacterium]
MAKKMNPDAKLTDEVNRLLEGKGQVLFHQESDLTMNRRFGRSYLICTDRLLITASETDIVAEYPLSTIKEIKVDELVGGGRLSAVASDGIHHLISYSNHMVPHFAVIARLITGHIQGRKIEMPPRQKHGFCPRCGAPLPERDTACPKCVPRLKIFTRLVSLTKAYKGKVITLMVVTAFGVVFQVVPPYLTKMIVDDVIGRKDLGKLWLYIGAMILAGVLYLVMRLVNIQLNAWISARIVADLRSRLHAVLQYLQLSFFNKREPGEIVGRVMNDTGELQQFLVEGIPFLLINTLSFIVIGAILIKINWILALLVFIPIPVFVFGSKWFWGRLTPLFHRQGSAIGHMHSMLTESILGLKVVKAFSQEQRRVSQFDGLNTSLAGTYIGIQRVYGSFNEVMYWVMSVGVAMVWLFAVRQIVGGSGLTLGDLLAFVGYIWLFYGPLQWFSVILNWMSHAFTGAERIFEVIDSAPESYNDPEAITLPQIRGEIEFKDVHFSYERGKEIIHGISFRIARGEMIGLVGKSGAGKSTIINLITRFFDPDSGEILIDRVPVKNLNLSQLRKNMGIVMQEPFLFNATIAENIAYGMEHAGFDDIVAAAKAAYAHDFIVRKDDGYDTMIGESGAKLSSGEKQRISIARAILHNPPVLILDEATSSVDATTEKFIQDAITKLIKGRTTIAIAHRLSTLRNADRLVVVDDGKIVEIGSHDELTKKQGVYAKLAESYSQITALRSVVWGG